VLLHGCCHNPTGADFTLAEWEEIADVLARRELLPFIDLAYQGLGDGFEADSAGARAVIARCGEGFVAYSCDKNFALYRERTGALMVFTREEETRKTVLSNVLSSARANWSMPPDHGAAIVETVLNDDALKALWLAELEGMRTRIAKMRHMLAAADADFTAVGVQRGLFSLLPVLPNGVAFLKEQHGIYFPASGRINVAGFTEENLPVFAKAWRDLKSRHPDFLYPISPSTSGAW
jgi:aromatic-amino-acid transaminase